MPRRQPIEIVKLCRFVCIQKLRRRRSSSGSQKRKSIFTHTPTHRYRMPDIKHTSTTMRISELCDFWIFWEENMGKTKKTHGNGLKRIATDWSAWRMGGKHREGWLRWWEAKQAFVYHENNNNECVRGQSTNWNYVNSFGGGVFVCVCVCVLLSFTSTMCGCQCYDGNPAKQKPSTNQNVPISFSKQKIFRTHSRIGTGMNGPQTRKSNKQRCAPHRVEATKTNSTNKITLSTSNSDRRWCCARHSHCDGVGGSLGSAQLCARHDC